MENKVTSLGFTLDPPWPARNLDLKSCAVTRANITNYALQKEHNLVKTKLFLNKVVCASQCICDTFLLLLQHQMLPRLFWRRLLLLLWQRMLMRRLKRYTKQDGQWLDMYSAFRFFEPISVNVHCCKCSILVVSCLFSEL